MIERTPEGLYKFAIENGWGDGFSKGNTLKHFSVGLKYVKQEEQILMVFIGLHNYQSITKHENNYAYIVTNERIIMSQKKVIGEVCHYLLWDNLNDVRYETKMLLALIVFDTIKETIAVLVDNKSAIKIASSFNGLLNELRNPIVAIDKLDIYEELKKLKELLDLGIITEAEFENKKKEIL